jgi:hypothetical protein
MAKTRKQRVGEWTITTKVGRTDDSVGIGARWSAQVDRADMVEDRR